MKIPAYLLEVLKALKDWQYEAVWARSPTVYSEPRLILDIETKEDCETKRAVRKIEAEKKALEYRCINPEAGWTKTEQALFDAMNGRLSLD